MARAEIERTVQQSVLDRLLDDDDGAFGSTISWLESVERLKRAVRRDLESLLNTRRLAEPAPERYEEVRRSMYHYGVPDITSLSRDAPDTYTRLQRYVQEAIQLFEPRLANVRVALVQGEGEERRELHFRIEALLRMDPTPEQVAFDTLIEIASGEVEVRSGSNA